MSATTTPTKCRRCHRPLTSPTSIAVGIGPRCARLDAVETTHSPTQIADAQELVEIGGVIPLRGRGVRRIYLTLGHHGDIYRTAISGQCNCRAGLVGKPCFHGAAVQIYANPGRAPRPVYIAAA